MIDREKVVSVLVKRFPEARLCDVAAAANAIVGLAPEFAAVEPDSVSTFRCDASGRQYGVHHLARGDVRLYYRTGR